jgi:hypothetical protein
VTRCCYCYCCCIALLLLLLHNVPTALPVSSAAATDSIAAVLDGVAAASCCVLTCCYSCRPYTLPLLKSQLTHFHSVECMLKVLPNAPNTTDSAAAVR